VAELMRASLFASLALAVSACGVLQGFPAGGQLGNVTPPRVAFLGASLAQAPSQARLAAFYCPEVVNVPLGGAALLCQGLFGRRPAPADMTVSFDLRFRVDNPNQVPIPLASVLTAVTVFPAATNQRLGASCVRLCAPGQAGCLAGPDPAACRDSARDIRTMDDFAGAAVGLLVAGGLSAAAGEPLSFTAPALSAAAQLDVTVRFSFGPNELLQALRQLAVQSVDELKQGRPVTFTIPYRLEGTVWFDVGSLGRIAVGYGPVEGIFTLPSEGLLPR
jgi:hypothetical protein